MGYRVLNLTNNKVEIVRTISCEENDYSPQRVFVDDDDDDDRSCSEEDSDDDMEKDPFSDFHTDSMETTPPARTTTT
ncbi:hypothetical protein PF005_g17077 [Phytophthora fragariae]|uniref:Uncharacterized protein n=1 Tax=Phytophthora fragariae TaxID=53985 RepID=A0A6A3JJ23_9STRA|nr:hypothetical protein PF003_g15411 [Phytophthora fragariae]KAE8931382.1 hypothetical protein PF009_g18554 [Phytophthora fragariae]KAE8995116.1 hypothetical protein PF011_g16465 [Phytophthora fragariae]KAE9095499.1 hypothetical protein PF010_g16683 [Phytophthora fragariae]KAE9095889.1 hypothetical protein PF007_g17216 [Phytophthora fragariae]